MSNMLQEFKQFAMKGNVVDMAVGIIIGAAFGKIVSSLVTDIIMPPIGLLIGGLDFTDFKIFLKEGSSPVTLNYGLFLQNLVNFLVVAFAMFMLIKGMNRLAKKQEETKEPEPAADVKLLAEIRDLLKARQ